MNDDAACELRLLVEGERACFRRPEFSSDLVTYDVMPPTVARRLVDACLPECTACATHVRVLKPIVRRWQTMRTGRGTKRCQILEDVAYVLRIETAPVDASVLASIRASLSKAEVHLGLSDFSARVSLIEDASLHSAFDGTGVIDLGWMLYDLKSGGRSAPRFFRAIMRDGVVGIPPEEAADLAA